MITFFQSTWFLWWAFAVVAILRWFHLQSADRKLDDVRAAASRKDEAGPVRGPLASHV